MILLVFLGAVVAGIVALATGAGAGSALSAKLEASGGTGTSFKTTTCAQAYTSLNTGTHTARRKLPIGPLLFPTITATSLSVAASPTAATCTTLTLQGTATLFNQTADVLVIGTWATAAATAPTFTIVFSFQTVSLSSLVAPTGTNLGVNLSHVWLATTTNGSTVAVTPGALPAANSSFFTGLTGTFTVATSGITFAGELTASGNMGTALSDLHINPSGIQLTGSLTGSVSNFSKTKAPTVSASLKLSVAVTVTLTPPSWLSFPSKAFSLTVTGASDHSWSVTVDGKATVTIPGAAATSSVTVSITLANGPVVTLSASLGTVTQPFGQSWLVLDKTALTWSISSSGTTATLSATATVDGTTFGVSVTLSSSNGVSATLSVTTTHKKLSAANLVTHLGLGTLPAGTPTLSITQLTISLADKSGKVTIAVDGQASVTINSKPFTVDALVRYDSDDGSLVVGLRPAKSFKLSQLITGLTPSMTMTFPNLALVISNKTVTFKSPTLDTATWKYFRGIYCAGTTNPRATSTCSFTVTVAAGVGLSATVTLPAKFDELVCKLVHPTKGSTTTGTCVTGPVTVTGQIPLFGGTKLGLTVSLPTVTVDAGAFRQITVFLSISKSGDSFSLDLGGKLVLLAPGSGTADCPPTIVPTATQVCLHLTITAAITFTKGVSVTLTGSLTGDWKLPSATIGLTRLTIKNITVQVGITAGEGVGVTLGARATIGVGTTTLGIGIDLEFTPEAPWVNLLGFFVKSGKGISMHDIAELYSDLSGEAAPSGLPPLALKNLFFSFATKTDPKLGLCTGLHISASLVFTTGAGTFSTTTSVTTPTTCTPTVLETHAKTSACSSDAESCLASVFLTVGPNGIVGSGHIGAWKAGPLHFTPVTLTVVLKKTEVQFDISGGGTLLTPITYATLGTTAPVWATGAIKLEVGTKDIGLSASVHLGGTKTLGFSISGSGSFDLLNPGFTLTSWFTQAKTWLTNAGTTVVNTFKTVGTTVKTWWTTYVAPSANKVLTDLHAESSEIVGAFSGRWQTLYSLFEQIKTKVTGFNSFVTSLTLTFLEFNVTKLFTDALHGIGFGGWLCTTIGCLVPSFHIPGLCTDGVTLGPLCSVPFTQLVTAAQADFANPAVNTKLGSVSLKLPPTTSDKTLVKTIHAIDPTTSPTPSKVISCATSTENYKTGTESPLSLTVGTLGNQVTVNGPQPTDKPTNPTRLGNPTQTTNDKTINQNTLDSLNSGQNQGSCSKPVTKVDLPPLAMSLTRSWVDEGGTVTVHGDVATPTITAITLDWGDGSAVTQISVSTTGAFTASHVYADETGTDTTESPYTVTLSATGVTPVTKKVSVLDTPLDLSAFAATDSTVDVMKPVHISGTIANPETDEPTTAVINWGDGTPATTVAVRTGTFSATHTYERLVPAGMPSQVEPVTVSVSEDDGTAVTGQTTVTVHDVAPSGTTLTATGGATTTNGVVFTHSGTQTSWTASALDVSPQQGLHFDVNWKDGTSDGKATASVTSGPNAAKLYTYDVATDTLSHDFANACYYTLATTVTDLDTLEAPPLATPVVVTRPLGAHVEGTGYWHTQVASAIQNDVRPPLTAAEVGCFNKIAQFLAPELGSTSLSQAATILQPTLRHLTSSEKTEAMLRQQLLTALMDFADGTWNWTQGIGPSRTPFNTLVGEANEALATGSTSQMQSILRTLEVLNS